MRKGITGFLSFAVTVAVVLAVLKVTNWLPTAIDKGTMRRYPSVEAAAAGTGIREIYVPSYFPETLGWPPSEILAQKKPFVAVVMEFELVDEGRTALVISQAEKREFSPDEKIRLVEINEKIPYDLAGREALLEVGRCKDRTLCSRITWDEDDRRVVIVMKSAPFELIKIAESMLH